MWAQLRPKRWLHGTVALLLVSSSLIAIDAATSPFLAVASGAPGDVDPEFAPIAGSTLTVALQSDGKIMVGQVNSPGIKRFNADGSASSITGSYGIELNSLFIAADDTIIAGGKNINNERVKKYSAAGDLLTFQTSDAPGFVYAVAGLADGSFYTGSSGSPYFRKYGPTAVLDSGFDTKVKTSTPAGAVNTIAVQENDQILVGYNSGFKRYNSDGSIDFTVTGIGDVHAIALLASGSILVGSTTAPYLRTYSSAGVLDSSFATNIGTTLNGSVRAIEIDAAGEIYAGGSFTAGLVKLSAAGAPDSTFNSRASSVFGAGGVTDLEIQPDGKILVATTTGVKRILVDYITPGVPLKPQAVAGDAQATVSVSAGLGIAPTSYTVSSVEDPTKTCVVNGASGSCVVTGLTNGTPYSFVSTATNGILSATSEASAASDPVTPLSEPIFQAAEVNSAGSQIVLTYNKALASATAAAENFEIEIDGALVSVSAVSVSGNSIILTPPATIGIGQVVTLKYTAPENSNLSTNLAIQNLAGEDASSLEARTITNKSITDITAPTLVSASSNSTGSQITLTFSEALNSTGPLASLFSVTSDSDVNSVTGVTVSGQTLVLSLTPSINEQQIVTVSYLAPDPASDAPTNRAIQDLRGNDMASVTDFSVINNSIKTETCEPGKSLGGVGGNDRAATEGGDGCVIVTYGSSTEEFSYIGLPYTWSVPEGVTSVSFKSYGAGGGGTTSGGDLGNPATFNGGAGGFVESTYAVTPGQSFYINVGKGGLGNLTEKAALTRGIMQVLNTSAGEAKLFTSVVHGFKVGDVVTVSGLTGAQALLNGTKTISRLGNSQELYFSSGSSTVIVNTNVSGASVSGPATCVGSVLPTNIGGGGAASNTGCATNQNNLYASGGGGSSVWTASTSPRLLLSAGGGGGASAQGAGGAGGGTEANPQAEASGLAGSGSGSVFGSGASITAGGTAGGAASPTISGAINGVAGGSRLTSGHGSALGANSTGGGGGGGGGYYGGGSGGTGGGGGGGSSIALAADLIGPALAASNPATLGTSGNSLVLTFNENLSSTTAPTGSFLVYADGRLVAVSSRSVSGSNLTLTLGATLNSDQIITVSYVKPASDASTSNAAVQDGLGNDGDSFTNVPVINNSSFGPDRVSPILAATNSVIVSGGVLTITMNEPLATAPLPNVDSFVVFVGGNAITPTAVAINGNSVVLTLPAAFPSGTEATVSYEAPSINSTLDNAAIQDINGNDARSFTQTNQPTNPIWDWTTPYDPAAHAVRGCDGAGSTNRIKQTQLPNGVYYSVGVTGTYLCINDATESLAQRGGQAQDFTATGLVTEPGLKITTSNSDCSADSLCGPRGVMTIYFSKPVKNPVVSFAGWGGGSGSSTAWTEMRLITPGLTVSRLSGTNIEVVDNGTYVQPIVKNPSISCHSTSGYGATAQAGCGSLQINGTVTSASFEVYLGTARGVGYLDAWNLTASISEDFGLVPSTYDLPVASHSIGDLRLGATVEADQASALYATTNADAVPRWTSLAGNAKADDGVADWVSSPSILFGETGSIYSTTVSLTGVEATANLCAWLDFNRDEVFAYSERFCTTVASGATSATLEWPVPARVVPGLTYARVRLSYDALTVATGKVSSGEVEDYSLTILSPSVPNAIDDVSIGNKGATQSISPLTNDQIEGDFAWDAQSLRLCFPGQTPDDCTATSLVVEGEGTFTVQSNGTVLFAPLADFVGTATPVTYQITDTSSTPRTRSSTITPTVIPKPTASPDVTSGLQGASQTINLLTNSLGLDAAAEGYELIPSSIKICAADEVAPNCTLNSATVSGVGTYTVDATGTMVFVPLEDYTGTPEPIRYTITDSSLQTASSTYTPTVVSRPQAVDDFSSGPFNTPQGEDVLLNDTAAEGLTLNETSVRVCLIDEAGEVAPDCSLRILNIADEGTYSVSETTGRITFTPLATFIGIATPITYLVADSMGQTVTATYTPEVTSPPLPTAAPNTSKGAADTNQLINPLGNDSAGTGTTFVLNSLLLCGPSEAAPNCTLNTLTVAGEGTYTVNSSTGIVTFDPEPLFTGVATPIFYQVTDSVGRTVSSSITPTVVGLPTAVPDTTSGKQGLAQTINLLANESGTGDTAASGATLDAASVKLCGASEISPNCSQTSVSVAGVGSYSVSSSGQITFMPLAEYSGTPAPLAYTVLDSVGQKAAASYTPTVIAAPVAVSDTTAGKQGATQTINLLSNAFGTGDLAGSGATLDSTSVLLCDSNPTAEIYPNCSKLSVTVAGVGTYTVNSAGLMTFVPLLQYSGTPEPITYMVSDSSGQTATATYTPTVVAPPAAVADTSTGAYNAPQTETVLENDTASAGAIIEVTSVKLCKIDPTADIPPNCSLSSLTTGQGTYAVNSDGSITFTPVTGFTGEADGVSYSITDSFGQRASASYVPTVGLPPVPSATPNTDSDAYDTNQFFDPLADDSPGAIEYPLLKSTLTLCDPSTAPAQTAPNCTATILIVANEGTYTVEPTTGVVTFDPLPTFTGKATPISYQAKDSLERVVTSTITATVGLPPAPSASPNTSSGEYDTNQLINPLGNDTPGAASYPLLANTVTLCEVGLQANCSLKSLTVAGQGTYTVDAVSGMVTFDPLPSFAGVATAITYQAKDSLNRVVTSTIIATVLPSKDPLAQPDVSSDKQGAVQTINPLTNDQMGLDEDPLIPSSLRLCLSTDVKPVCTALSLSVADQGFFEVDTDSGLIIFTPLPLFTGTASPVSYSVEDDAGRPTWSTYTPTVIPPPTAVADATTGPQNVPQSINVITNTSSTSDVAGEGTTLVPGSISIACTPDLIDVVCSEEPDGSVVVAEQGSYTVALTGVITFTPLPSFLGVAAPVTYTVADALGQTATSTYTPTVVEQALIIEAPASIAPLTAPPTALPDVKRVAPGATVTFQEITGPNGLASGFNLVLDGPGRTCIFMTGTQVCALDNKVTIPGEGTFTLDPTSGLVTFEAFAQASLGLKTSVSYRVTDSNGLTAISTLTPLIDVPMLVARDDTQSGPYDTRQLIHPLKNDVAGHSGAPLDPRSLRFCGILAKSVGACEQTELTTADGRYVLNIETAAVTFYPRAGFTGRVTEPIFYTVQDVAGRVASAKITPYVGPRGVQITELADTGLSMGTLPYLLIILLFLGVGLTRITRSPRA